MIHLIRALLFLVAILFTHTPAFAEPRFNVLPALCALQGMVLDEMPWSKTMLENGLEDYMFDLNGDGWADLEILVPTGDRNRVPLMYWMNGEDGKAKYTLKDSRRDGTCRGMTVIWHQYQPDWKGGA